MTAENIIIHSQITGSVFDYMLQNLFYVNDHGFHMERILHKTLDKLSTNQGH